MLNIGLILVAIISTTVVLTVGVIPFLGLIVPNIVSKILFEEMPIIPIHFYNQVYLQNEAVTGIVRHPVGYLELKWADKN